MNKEYFLYDEIKKEIDNSFIKNGWVTIYKTDHKEGDEQTIFCCLVSARRIKAYRTDRDWKIRPGSEGKPTIYGNGKYTTYDEKGIEPFVFSKHFRFSDGHGSYVDVSEEFVLYFRLYEKVKSKQNR